MSEIARTTVARAGAPTRQVAISAVARVVLAGLALLTATTAAHSDSHVIAVHGIGARGCLRLMDLVELPRTLEQPASGRMPEQIELNLFVEWVNGYISAVNANDRPHYANQISFLDDSALLVALVDQCRSLRSELGLQGLPRTDVRVASAAARLVDVLRMR